MNKYELTVIVRNRETETIKEKVKEILQRNGVSITLEDHWGIKELAYEIDKNTKGDFWIYNLTSESPIKLKEFNLMLNRESNIIRYLILKKE